MEFRDRDKRPLLNIVKDEVANAVAEHIEKGFNIIRTDLERNRQELVREKADREEAFQQVLAAITGWLEELAHRKERGVPSAEHLRDMCVGAGLRTHEVDSSIQALDKRLSDVDARCDQRLLSLEDAVSSHAKVLGLLEDDLLRLTGEVVRTLDSTLERRGMRTSVHLRSQKGSLQAPSFTPDPDPTPCSQNGALQGVKSFKAAAAAADLEGPAQSTVASLQSMDSEISIFGVDTRSQKGHIRVMSPNAPILPLRRDAELRQADVFKEFRHVSLQPSHQSLPLRRKPDLNAGFSGVKSVSPSPVSRSQLPPERLLWKGTNDRRSLIESSSSPMFNSSIQSSCASSTRC
mmetsp:Transcript_43415/g.114407  ORF Transcript_43415/g.114407 Transcript_43415/m.114407 type:complete len:348 (-) Transcript_43415:173-1216(-)